MTVFFFTLKGQQKQQKYVKYVKKKSRLPPDIVKRTVGEIEAVGGNLINIRGVLTLLFWKSSSNWQVEKQTKEESSRVYQCKGWKSEDTGEFLH